ALLRGERRPRDLRATGGGGGGLRAAPLAIRRDGSSVSVERGDARRVRTHGELLASMALQMHLCGTLARSGVSFGAHVEADDIRTDRGRDRVADMQFAGVARRRPKLGLSL